MRRPFCRTELDMLPDGRCQRRIMYRWPPDASRDAFERCDTTMQCLKLTMKRFSLPLSAPPALPSWHGLSRLIQGRRRRAHLLPEKRSP